MKYVLIDDDIELCDDDRQFKIFSNRDKNIIAICGNDVFTYELTKLPFELTEKEKEEILNYRGILYTEKVTCSDIFIHGKFVKNKK